jgi:hypothetical protein
MFNFEKLEVWQGKILIAPGAPPAECRERKAAGASSGFGKERG